VTIWKSRAHQSATFRRRVVRTEGRHRQNPVEVFAPTALVLKRAEMRICLVDARSSDGLPEEAASYVGWLAPALAEEHRVTILTVQSTPLGVLAFSRRLRRAPLAERPDIIHFNNLAGITLGMLTLILREQVASSPALVLGIHSELLLQRDRGLNRRSTRGFRTVVSPAASLLDRHLAADFFQGARHEVIPYAMPYHAERLTAIYRRALNDHRAGNLHDRAA